VKKIEIQDITPSGSKVRVYLDPTPLEPSTLDDLETQVAAETALRQSAFQKLMVGKPLTEDEARTMVGG